MVGGPEIADILRSYEESIDKKGKSNDNHHEQIPSVQKHFLADVRNILSVFERLGTHLKKIATNFILFIQRLLFLKILLINLDLRKKKQ